MLDNHAIIRRLTLIFLCLGLLAACNTSVVPGQVIHNTDNSSSTLSAPTSASPLQLQGTQLFPGQMLQITGSPQDQMAGRKIIGESDHFIYYELGDFFPVDLTEWQGQFENVYAYVSDRLNLEAQVKIKLAFDKPDISPCPGRAFAGNSAIIILADEHTDPEQILGVLAHEIGHALTFPALENQLQNYLYFEEGYATWAAGDYWTYWHGFSSIDEMVQSYQSQSSYVPLSQATDFTDVEPGFSAGSDCLVRRDILYTEWAGFIGYLIQTAGTQKLYMLFNSGGTDKTENPKIEMSPDYEGVYGLTLNQLEADWLATIAAAGKP